MGRSKKRRRGGLRNAHARLSSRLLGAWRSLPRREKAWWAGAAVLALFLSWQAFEVGRFIRIESRPPAWDQANHLDVALQYWEALKRGEPSILWTHEPKHYIPPFPPLYHLSIAPACATADPAGNALWSNWVYLVLLCIAVFGIASELRKDDTAAAAAVLFASAPAVQHLLHTQLVDLSLTACAAAGYWAWLRSDGFRRKKASLFFGVVFAIGMLHKWSFFSYMIPVYVSAARALRRRESRGHVLSAALLSCALFMPWYVARIPLLLQRLVQASADQAVPFWRGGAFFHYLRVMPDQLGLLFTLAAVLAAGLSARRRASWPVLACILASYVFWALVPNRQMRYLLPGLTGLTALIAFSFPRPAVWALAAVQLFGAANRSFGWLGPLPVSLPGIGFEMLAHEPPVHEDWKHAEILREIESLSSEGPHRVAVVANHERFNHLSLLWEARRRGMRDVRFDMTRNKLWELDRFVLYKQGGLGPASVIGGLQEAETRIVGEGSGFRKGFEEEGRWPLPDGSEAVLYRRRGSVRRPLPPGASRLKAFETQLFRLEDVHVEAENWDPASSTYGRIVLEPEKSSLRGLRISGLRLAFRDALLLPDRGNAGAQLVALGRLEILEAVLRAEDLRAFARRKGVGIDSLESDGTVRVRGRAKGLPFSAEAAIRAEEGPDRIVVEPLSLRIGPLPLPVRLLNRLLASGRPFFEVELRPESTLVRTRLWAGLERTLPFSVRKPVIELGDRRIRIR